MPPGCNPLMLDNLTDRGDLPIEAITIDGCSHPTTLRELPALAQAVSARAAAQQTPIHPCPSLSIVAPSSMLTPEERMAETISTVRRNAAEMHEKIKEERRVSAASSSASSAGVRTPAPDADAEIQEKTIKEEPREITPPPVLEAPQYSPDSPRSLTIDESMDESVAPPPPPQPMQGIPV